MDSILDTIKKMLNIETTYTDFDIPIIASINSALMVLNQLGVGPSTIFKIEDNTSTWSSFIGTTSQNIEGVKEYIYLKTRLVFDPPTASSVLDSIGRQISELEYRLLVQTDPSPTEV